MMEKMLVVVGITLLPLLWPQSSVLCLPLPQDGAAVHVELLRTLDNQRVRRDVTFPVMPDTLVLKFQLQADDVILRLNRVHYPPLYVVKGQGVVEPQTFEDGPSAVYVDPTRSASFIVRKTDSGQYVLDGNLKHEDRQLLMTPLTRHKRSSDNNNNNNNNNTNTNNNSDNMHIVVAPPQPEVLQFDNGASGEHMKNRGQGSNRSKRQTTVAQHVVETVFVIDHTDNAAWNSRSATLADIREYYTYIGQTLNNIYASVKEVDNTIDIKVAVTGFFIVESSNNAIFQNSSGVADGGVYLDAFASWIPANLPAALVPSDHYMAFTAYDVVLNGGVAVGVAKSAVVCESQSVSVVENSFRASVANIAAHELGHSLSADHDGSGDSVSCSLGLQNIMSPAFIAPPVYQGATDANLFRFSACSVASFKSYLAGETCTEPSQTAASLELPFQGFASTLITNRTQQCRYSVGSDSSFCDPSLFSGYNEEDLCIGMLCRIPSSIPNVINCTYVLPFEGTPCGSDKACSRGLCVDASSIVPAPQTFTEPTTPAPTTQAPTTQAPTTQAPTTQAPTTQAPTTQAPTTQAPTTQAPTTQAPTTQAPTTQAPTTQAPTTQAPTTQAPTTQAPTTQAPTTQAPTTQAPTTQAPTTQAPTTQAPTTQAPTTQAPTTQAPTTQAPTTQAPTTQAPTTQAPTTQAPTTQAPTTQAPTTQAPTTQAPTTQAPTTQAPTTQAPTTQAPTTQAPTTQAPTTQAPTTQAPTTQAPTTQAPTTQAPTTQAPTTQAPTTQAPTTQAPTTQAPMTDEAGSETSTESSTESSSTQRSCRCFEGFRRARKCLRELWRLFRGLKVDIKCFEICCPWYSQFV